MSKADKLKPVTKASKADAWLEPKGEKIVEKTAKKDVVPPKFSRLQYYAYVVEGLLSRQHTQLAVFAVAVVVFSFFGGALLLFGGGLGESNSWRTAPWAEVVWETWLLIISSYAQAEAFGYYERIIAGVMSAVGVVFICYLTAMLAEFVRMQQTRYREGRTSVIESGHTVLIGWNDRSLGFIEQISIARQDYGGGIICVLVEKNSEDIERKFLSQTTKRDMKGTRVIFRTGEPQSLACLKLVGIATARSVVLMSSGDDPRVADANTLRILIALRVAGLQPDSYIVAEVRDPDIETVIKITGGSNLETIRSAELNAKVSLGAVKQPGIMAPFEELFGFEGSEFYTVHVPGIKNMLFGDLFECFPEAIPIGVQKDGNENVLCPKNRYIMTSTDKVILISENENGCKFVGARAAKSVAVRSDLPDYEPPELKQERLLVCGWGENLGRYLKVMNTLFSNAEVHLLNTIPIDQRESAMFSLGLDKEDTKNLTLVHLVGNPTVWAVVKPLRLNSYHCAVVISDFEHYEISPLQSDSHNLAVILLLHNHRDLYLQAKRAKESNRDIDDDEKLSDDESNPLNLLNSLAPPARSTSQQQEKKSNRTLPIFCEILESTTSKLIEDHPYMSGACHTLNSNRLLSKILAIVSEDRNVRKILDLLLDGKVTLSLMPSVLYANKKEEVSFIQIMKRAQIFRHIVLGYQHAEMLHLTSINPTLRRKPRNWALANFIVLTNTKHESLRTGTYEQFEKEGKASEVFLQRSGGKHRRHSISTSHPMESKSHLHFEKAVTGSISTGENEHLATTSTVEIQTIEFVLDEENSLGFRIQDLSHDSSQQYAAGLAVSGLAEVGQAENKGVQVGWYVIAVDGRAVQSQAELLTKIAAAKFDAKSLGTACVVKVSFMPLGGEHFPGELSLRLQVARLESEVQQHARVSADAIASFSESKQAYERKIAFLQQKLIDTKGGSGSIDFSPRGNGSASSTPKAGQPKGVNPRASARSKSWGVTDAAGTRNVLHSKSSSVVAM